MKKITEKSHLFVLLTKLPTVYLIRSETVGNFSEIKCELHY